VGSSPCARGVKLSPQTALSGLTGDNSMESQNSERPFFRVKEACTALGISRSTLNRWVAQGIVRPIKIRGSVRRFYRHEIEALARGARS
jgi:excisionase family DNA binding protein